MNKSERSCRQLHRLAPPCLAVFVAMALLAPIANATPYVAKLVQQGNDVIATGSGAFDLTGLAYHSVTPAFPAIDPFHAGIILGFPSPSLDVYTGITGPTSIGNGSPRFANGGSGDTIGFEGSTFDFGDPVIAVPSGYLSGAALSSTAAWDNATFASLGVTPGRYVWTWGTGPEQSFTLEVGNAVGVPEPATLGMFGLGALLIGAFAGLRRRAG